MKKLLSLMAAFSLVFPVFSENFGVVLSGGGAKGAYEIGVWRAFEEYGIAQKTTVFSGTSVGGLNSAMFTCAPLDEGEKLWREVVPHTLSTDYKFIDQNGVRTLLDAFDLTILQKNKWPKVYVTACRDEFTTLKILSSFIFEPSMNASRFLLNDEKETNEIKQKLLATSAVPYLTDPILLSDGHKYVDGGMESYGGDNTPLIPVGDNHPELDTIFVVYLYAEPEYKPDYSKYPDKKIIEIIPAKDLGGLLGSLDFSGETISRLIDQGYNDAVKVLKENDYKPVSSFWFEE